MEKTHKKESEKRSEAPLHTRLVRRISTVGRYFSHKAGILASAGPALPPALKNRFTEKVLGGRTVNTLPSSLRGVILQGLEDLRHHRTGHFIAANAWDYYACWMRDQLYCALPYFYIGETEKFVQSVHVMYDYLEMHMREIAEGDYTIDAKVNALTLKHLTKDWGHHQVDAIGLLLFTTGFAHKHGITIVRNDDDRALVQLLVDYLARVEYWARGDYGVWEIGVDGDEIPHGHKYYGQPVLRSSSIGAAVAGLMAVKEQELAAVPEWLITNGRMQLDSMLPNEIVMDDEVLRSVDLALLTLIWPYRIVSDEVRDEILRRVYEKLVHEYGVVRYLGCNWPRRDKNGVSMQWVFGLAWLAIIEQERGNHEEAKNLFDRSLAKMTSEGHLAEGIIDGEVNEHTPLAWTHAICLIAYEKLYGNARSDR